MDQQGRQGKGKFNDGKGKGERDDFDDRKGDRKGPEKGKRKGDGKGKGDKGERSEKGEKGDRKGDGKGEKGKGKREAKVMVKGLRGKVISFVNGKPSGFIQRTDGEKDVFFDLADVVDGELLERDDIVEFDIVEGLDKKS
ncbi:unnamed protein product [Effrenium voratum]|uniref:CSD domain-containing protein n=1 Tax=Effrenium voratum TaxID=2562239 RepID=A0AA36IFT2_9DINO|nr:unnamed protein product [Effrenium voratum]